MIPRGLLKEHAKIFSWCVYFIDIFIVMLGCYSAYYCWFHQFIPFFQYGLAILIAGILTVFIFPFFGLYQSVRALKFWTSIFRLIQSVFATFVLLAGLAFLTKTGEEFSRIWFVLSAGFSFLGLFIFRSFLLYFLRFMRSRGWNERRIILIGAGRLGEKIFQMLQQKTWTGLRVESIFDNQFIGKTFENNLKVEPIPVDLGEWINRYGHLIDEIWLAFPLENMNLISDYLYQLRHETVTVRCVMDIFAPGFSHLTMTEINEFPLLNLNLSPMMGINRFVKAIEDRVLSGFILFFLSPVMLLIALGIKLDSTGPIFYKQKRLGWKGEEFEMLKFRTMPVGIEKKTGPVWAKQNESRATRLGQFLRKTSLDELPQFINVLKGEMSIVGPRPERLYFVEQFKDKIPGYMKKHMVKAGITGWAQVNGWRGNTSLEKRIEYDLYYIEHWSVFFDLKIIFLTLIRGFIHRNAY